MPTDKDPAAARSTGALPVPPLLPGQPPIALLVDYDGTIASVDVADQIVLGFAPEDFHLDNAEYSAGVVGSRALMARQVPRLPIDPGPVLALAARQPHDLTFAPFVVRALELGVAIEVVSDGFGFYIEPALRRLGVPEIPVATSRTIFDGTTPRMEFPNGHPDCFVCGTCKRQRVLAHLAAGRTVVFIGDGASDRYAAAYSDLIFAKHHLVSFCAAEGLPYTPWRDFAGVGEWLERTVATWRVEPMSLPAHASRPFVCGPEVWGPGRSNPPAHEPMPRRRRHAPD
jgi:2-hydroxy-3-keto-5-methylthiopentenyl-1-phosphate phosphatase